MRGCTLPVPDILHEGKSICGRKSVTWRIIWQFPCTPWQGVPLHVFRQKQLRDYLYGLKQ